MKPRKTLPASAFLRHDLTVTSIMSAAEYMALLKAARDKHKMPEFYQWQHNRKIILKGD